MSKKILKVNQSIILYDDTLIHDVNDDIFNSAIWQNNQTLNENTKGRDSVFFIDIEGKSCALKHYCRGGLLAKLIYDQYLYLGIEKTRSFREWELLLKMREMNLPVPRPIAARVRRNGFLYSADLLSKEIKNIDTFGDKLSLDVIDQKLWPEIGKCISKFHSFGIFHSDLNIENIQIDNKNNIYLLDFDKTKISKKSKMLIKFNLKRLRRSIEKKMIKEEKEFPYSGWSQLIKEVYVAE